MLEPALGRADIERYLLEAAQRLTSSGTQHVVVMVGGSLLAMHGLRGATHDVDSIRRLDAELVGAVAQVAELHGLAPAWLNDRAAAFTPATFEEATCTVLIDHPRLRVLGAPLEQVFVMKLFAVGNRANDYDDLVALWPRCDFDSPAAAVALHDAACPHAEPDPFLVDFIGQIAARASI